MFVGASKEKLDPVECDMYVADVTSLSGPFVKFVVEEAIQLFIQCLVVISFCGG